MYVRPRARQPLQTKDFKFSGIFIMAYIPPHRRHSNPNRPSPTPELLVPQFKRNLNRRPSNSNEGGSGKAVPQSHISRWFAVNMDGDKELPSSLHLEPISLESIEWVEKPLVLVNSDLAKVNDEAKGNMRRPWVNIAENVWQILQLSLENMRKLEIECQGLRGVIVTPVLAARIGKVHFHGKCPVAETTLRRSKKSFHRNVPPSYAENIINGVVEKTGFDFEEADEYYFVTLSRPGSGLVCECRVREDKKLKLDEVHLYANYYMGVSISCLDKNPDLRLVLYSGRRNLSAVTDDEIYSIKNLINSAVVDPEVKGGLKWPLGKAETGERYSVVKVENLKVKTYRNPPLKLNLEVRHADRFNFRDGTGEAAWEVTLDLEGIVLELQEKKVETDAMCDTFKDTLRLIWENFLN